MEQEDKLGLGLEDFHSINDNLEKSFDVELVFNDKEEQFKFNKTGAEIKARLEEIKVAESIEAQMCIVKLQEYQTKIGVVPVGPLTGYNIDKHRAQLKWLPMMYTYEQRQDGQSTDSSVEHVESKVNFNVPQEHSQCARDYNDISRKVGNLLVSMIKLNTLIKNLSEKKSYKLSVRQLTALGL